MYAVTGITGRVGGIVAGTLLDAGLPVRAVVRAAEKGRPWAEKGCEVAIASVADADGLAKAFSGVDVCKVPIPDIGLLLVPVLNAWDADETDR